MPPNFARCFCASCRIFCNLFVSLIKSIICLLNSRIPRPLLFYCVCKCVSCRQNKRQTKHKTKTNAKNVFRYSQTHVSNTRFIFHFILLRKKKKKKLKISIKIVLSHFLTYQVQFVDQYI